MHRTPLSLVTSVASILVLTRPSCGQCVKPLTCQRRFCRLAFNGGTFSIIDKSAAAFACWCSRPPLQLLVKLSGGGSHSSCCFKGARQLQQNNKRLMQRPYEWSLCLPFICGVGRQAAFAREGTRSSPDDKEKPYQSCCTVPTERKKKPESW